MEKLNKILEEIKEHQMQTVQLARTTKVYKLAEKAQKQALIIAVVSNWVAVKKDLPDNDSQVFVKYENGKYGINEWWESDNCWKYNFANMIVKEWCKPPCC